MQNNELKKNSEVLRKCAFCGGEAGILKNGVGNYQVYCDNCEIRQYAYAHKTREEAIKAWNNRKPLERVIERLEEEIDCSPWGKGVIQAHYLELGLHRAIEIIKEELM